MIRSTKHTVKFANTEKKKSLSAFLSNYKIAVQEYIDYLWNNKIYQDNILKLDIQNDILNCPSFINYKLINSKSFLSARALSSAATQACGIVSGLIKKRGRYLYIANKLKEKNDLSGYEKITKKLEKIKISKPVVGKIKAELSSKLIDIEFDKTSFDCFLRLKSLGENFDHIKIPIKLTKQDHKWNKGKLLGSFLVSENYIEFRYENPNPKLKEKGVAVGADTGINSVITLSDKQKSPLVDIHGHSLNSILDKLSRKKKGSKSFRKTQDHRKNFINWSINQLNLENINQINLEHINNLFYKKNFSKKIRHFTNADIENKLKRFSEEAGVRLVMKSSAYKSQRCSNCGLVHYLNRKGKLFKCKGCGFIEDADYNASLNNEVDLPNISFQVTDLKLNKKDGFYWKPEGMFNLDGQEFGVPDRQVK